jgi:methylmalonyl-CoA/ethylmalonyl-CoA epimerase
MRLPSVNPHLLLDNSFITRTSQLCIVTDDFETTVRQYADRLGIGPWWINEYRSPELCETTYYGRPVAQAFRIGLAFTGDFNWEIIQPLEGPTIYDDHLERHGCGPHHVGVYLSDFDADWDAVVRSFLDRGCTLSQEGRWQAVRWKYFDPPEGCHITIELIDRPAGWVRPDPIRWYPHAPKPLR